MLAIASMWLLPDPAALHFGADGAANGFASPAENSLAMIGFSTLMAIVFIGTAYLMLVLPASLINLPNKDYWLSEQRRPETMKKIAAFMDEMGIGTMAFFLLLQWEILQANRLDPPRLSPNVMNVATVVLVAFLLIVTVRILLAFRLPKNADQPI